MWTQTFIPQSNISFWQPGRQAQLIDVKTQISWFCCQSHTGHRGSECRRGDMGRHKLGNVTEYQWDSSFMLLLRTWKCARLTGIGKTNKETKAPFEVLLKFLSGTKTPNHRYSLKIAFSDLPQFMANGIWKILSEIRLKSLHSSVHVNHLPCVSRRGDRLVCSEISALFLTETVLKGSRSGENKESIGLGGQSAAGRMLSLPTISQSVSTAMLPGGPGPGPATLAPRRDSRAFPLCREAHLNRRYLRRPEHGPRHFDVTRRFSHPPLEWRIWLLLQENMTASSLWWAESEFWKGDVSVAPFHFSFYHLGGDKGEEMKNVCVPLAGSRGGWTIRLCGFWGWIKRFDTRNNDCVLMGQRKEERRCDKRESGSTFSVVGRLESAFSFLNSKICQRCWTCMLGRPHVSGQCGKC